MQNYSDFLHSRVSHPYTTEKNNLLYSAVEEAAEKHTAIDFHRIQHILHPGDIVLIGFGQNSAHDTLFEIQGLRWAYNGAVYRALIAPRARYRQIPGIEWYVPITVCEDDGTSWTRTHMLRQQYRCEYLHGVAEVK